MKNSLFICLDNIEWTIGFGPTKDEILTFDRYLPSGRMVFVEYDMGGYDPIYFREIQPPMDIKIEYFIVEKQTV